MRSTVQRKIIHAKISCQFGAALVVRHLSSSDWSAHLLYLQRKNLMVKLFCAGKKRVMLTRS